MFSVYLHANQLHVLTKYCHDCIRAAPSCGLFSHDASGKHRLSKATAGGVSIGKRPNSLA